MKLPYNNMNFTANWNLKPLWVHFGSHVNVLLYLVVSYLYLQKRMNHLQITINRLIPRDAINTKRRQKLFIVIQWLRDKCANYASVCVFFLKPDEGWTIQIGQLSKTCYKDILHLIGKGNKKLALPIKKKTKQRQDKYSGDHNPRKRSNISKNI